MLPFSPTSEPKIGRFMDSGSIGLLVKETNSMSNSMRFLESSRQSSGHQFDYDGQKLYHRKVEYQKRL